MHPVSCTNTNHDVTDLINHGWLKIQKLEYLETEHKFSMKQKALNLCFRCNILTSYNIVVEVIFKFQPPKAPTGDVPKKSCP